MPRVPGATYRLQLHKGFTFDDAAAIAVYLRRLGVTHVYSSPYLQAAPGSTHGYDVVDHRKVNEELGGADAHERFSKTLSETGLGQILDIVPNHMSLSEQNRYWWDVLENGANSRYASFFDIDWNSSEERLRDKVMVPILPEQYGRVVSAGGIVVVRRGSTFNVEASGQSLPVAPQTLAPLFARAADYAWSDMLSFLADSYARLPSPEFSDRATVLARDRDKAVLHTLFDRLCREEISACEAVDRAVKDLNTNPDALDEFLSQQNYRLAYWKTADQQLGYRRFFDVNTLIGLRVEREYVFEETHALILKWLKQGVIDGVRVDHPDGLRDPQQYFQRLRSHAPEAWIVGEKILEPGEWLRDPWPVQGTSGYDFLNTVLGVIVNPTGLKRLGEHYARFTGDNLSFPTVAHDKKIAVMQEALGSDVNRLTSLLIEICESHREVRDFTRAEARRAIREVAACFSVYRTYVVPERNEISDEDRHRIERAINAAKANRTDIDGLLFDFMRDVLELRITGRRESEFVYRFQQFTSPVMAKGVEDTAFYCSNRLTSMNEVGGDPDCGGVTLENFHAYNARMQSTFPTTMLALSTHDTKRSDDVRARMAVLSEMPNVFAKAVKRWSALGKKHRESEVDRGTEWVLYQTIVGAWPISPDRLKEYMQKAMREAKLKTSWVANNTAYEDALNRYIESLLQDSAFIADMEPFVQELLKPGRINSLTQSLIKHTAPGVPDLYQGGELWDLSLVDPDNRRPVDYKLRDQLLQEVETLCVKCVMQRIDEGLPKLWTIHRALQARAQHPEFFSELAGYQPITAKGTECERVIAYLRGDSVMTIVPRWCYGVADWTDTSIEIPQGQWKNHMDDTQFSGGLVKVETLWRHFPVALLIRVQE